MNNHILQRECKYEDLYKEIEVIEKVRARANKNYNTQESARRKNTKPTEPNSISYE